jgi:hypothetical protein
VTFELDPQGGATLMKFSHCAFGVIDEQAQGRHKPMINL